MASANPLIETPSPAEVPGGKLLSPDDKKTIGKIAEAVKAKKCILFLGSGVHFGPPAHLAGKYPYPDHQRPPVGGELAQQLAGECEFEKLFPGGNAKDLQRVSLCYELDKSKSRNDLCKELEKRVHDGKEPSPVLRAGKTRLPDRRHHELR